MCKYARIELMYLFETIFVKSTLFSLSLSLFFCISAIETATLVHFTHLHILCVYVCSLYVMCMCIGVCSIDVQFMTISMSIHRKKIAHRIFTGETQFDFCFCHCGASVCVCVMFGSKPFIAHGKSGIRTFVYCCHALISCCIFAQNPTIFTEICVIPRTAL